MSSSRVLFVDHTAALGGAELYLLDVARDTPHCEVVLFEDGPFRQRLEDAQVPVTILQAPDAVLSVSRAAGIRSMLTALPALLILIVRLAVFARSFDVLYLNSQKALIAGSVAAWLARRPAIWNLHDIITADHFSDMNRSLAIFCANRFVDRVVVNSEATRDAYTESGGRTPTELVYNGLDPAPYDAVTPEDIDRVRADIGLGDRPVIGMFSRLAPWKGQHVLLEAMVDLPDVDVVLVGGALFDSDIDYERRLKQLVIERNLDDRVHFLGFRDDIPTLMRCVDVVVHASTAPEPFGRVVVEGMLARRPVVATRAGGVPEIIDDPATGRLVPPDAPDALAETLRSVLSDPLHTQQQVRDAYDHAAHRFSLANTRQGVSSAIRHTLS